MIILNVFWIFNIFWTLQEGNLWLVDFFSFIPRFLKTKLFFSDTQMATTAHLQMTSRPVVFTSSDDRYHVMRHPLSVLTLWTFVQVSKRTLSSNVSWVDVVEAVSFETPQKNKNRKEFPLLDGIIIRKSIEVLLFVQKIIARDHVRSG